MSNRELLKEAIADAKAVKEMAISNAKAALEEAFTPQLKSLLEKKLTEMDEEDEKEMEEAMHDKEETMTEEELNELLNELEEGEKEHEMEEAKDHDEKMEEADDKEEMHEEEEELEAEEEEEIDLEDMTEEDLKAFIEDVVDEMIAAGELEAGDEEMEAPEEEVEVTDEESEEETEEEPMMENSELVTEVALSPEEEAMLKAFLEKPAGSKPTPEEAKLLQKLDENTQLNEIFGITMATIGAVKLLGIVFGLIGGALAAKYKSLKNKEKAKLAIIMPYLEKKMAGKDREEVLKNGILRIENDKFDDLGLSDEHQKELTAMKEGYEEETVEEVIDPTGADFQALADALGVTMETAKYITVAFGLSVPVILGMIHTGGAKAVDFIKKTYKKLTGKDTKTSDDDMMEALATVETLKAELNEVNLLNSKLLYTNKIFKAKNLTEAQKVRVLTTFDKAESVKEVKLVYETLIEGLVSTSTPKEAIKESKSFASKAVGISPKKPVVETDGMVSRFQKLAGIK